MVVVHALAAPGRVEMDFQVEKVLWVDLGREAEEAAVREVLGLMQAQEMGAMVEMVRAPASQALPHFMAAEVAALLITVTLVLEARVVGATGESTISQRMALPTRVVAGAEGLTAMYTARAGPASSSSATSTSPSA